MFGMRLKGRLHGRRRVSRSLYDCAISCDKLISFLDDMIHDAMLLIQVCNASKPAIAKRAEYRGEAGMRSKDVLYVSGEEKIEKT